ncbi:MAG: WYL domain-containing protein [Coriobacteriales bacterium]|nr:WYL domain-containing protein [Coriobacteriales bacterium]
MAANSNQKLKILYLYKMLREQTDSQHGLTMADILQNLEEKGITAERKSIYRDIDVLREFGCNIETRQRCPVEYELVRDGLGLDELMLLIDAVQGCRFITERMSNQLTKAIGGLASISEREKLDKRVHVDGRIKSKNESVFFNLDRIHEAMQKRRKVSFLYYKHDVNFDRVSQHDGKYRTHTPVQVIFSDGFYYLVAWNDDYEDFRTYRIDRMNLLQVSDEPATRDRRISNYRYEDFAQQAFGMFHGDPVTVTLLVEANAVDSIVDRFGENVTSFVKDGKAEVHVKVRKSQQFFGWVAGFNNDVKIVAPESVVEEYRDWLRGLLEG